jgi:hypothetical protein
MAAPDAAPVAPDKLKFSLFCVKSNCKVSGIYKAITCPVLVVFLILLVKSPLFTKDFMLSLLITCETAPLTLNMLG